MEQEQLSKSSIEIVEIRDLSYPILEVFPEGVDVNYRPSIFDVCDRFYFQHGECNEAIMYDAVGRRCTIIATRIYDLSNFQRFLQRSGDFFIGDNWKTGVRAEIDCKIEAQLSFSEVKAELMKTLLANKDWWYDLTEKDIRSIFNGCETFKEAYKSVKRVGIDYKPKPWQKSEIFTDLTVRQKLKSS